MTVKVNTISLKKGIQVGDDLMKNGTHRDGPGKVGMIIEDILQDRGYQMNRGPGIDMVNEGLEVKSRNEDSTSNHSIGSMSAQSIINTPWKGSEMQKKTKRQLRVKWKDDNGAAIVTESKVYDFSKNHIQSRLEQDYEHVREELRKGNGNSFISSPNKFIQLQKQKSDRYQVRIYNKAMKIMEDFDAKIKPLTDNFDFGPDGL